MDKQPVFRRSLIAAATALALLGASPMARAVDELEGQNNSLTGAQKLTIGSDGSVSVNGVVGVLSGSSVLDVDFYSFDAKAGDMVTFDIDGGSGGLRKVDTILFLFGPGIDQRLVADDADSVDEGSSDEFGWVTDSYLVHSLPLTGTYTVAVTGYGVWVAEDGTYSAPMGILEEGNGDYKLIISGVTPPASMPPDPTPVPVPEPLVQKINIDIRSSAHAMMYGKHKGEVTVALLASPTFNPAEVNESSLTFGITGDETTLKRCDRHDERVGKKGPERRRHLVCHFNTDAAGLDVGDLEGVVKGQTSNGTAFEGRGFLKVGKPKKRGPRHHRAGR